jgi:hypoxanthine phosphoribosyltransferase
MKTVQIKDRKFQLLLSEEEIQAAVRQLADGMNRNFKDQQPLFLAVLNGAFMFASDLMKHITIPSEISFIKLASYHGMQQGNEVRQVIGLSEPIRDRTIVVLEDIIDSGHTIQVLHDSLEQQHPASVHIASLLLKPSCLKYEIPLEYLAFQIPDRFVVGYGMDYDGLGRNLPDIYSLSEQ